MQELSRIEAELDAMHARAKDCFERRDLEGYRDLFAPGLEYRQADGRVIGRDRLMRDVAAQFRRFNRVESSTGRRSIGVEGDRATEVLTQAATLGVTAFLVVHRTWHLAREARYIWAGQGGRWRVEAVEVLEEKVVGRFRFGLRRPGSR